MKGFKIMLQIFHDQIFWTAKSERKSSSAVDELPNDVFFVSLPCWINFAQKRWKDTRKN